MFTNTFFDKKLFVHMEHSIDFVDSFSYDDVFATVFIQNRVLRIRRLLFGMVQFCCRIGDFGLYMS